MCIRDRLECERLQGFPDGWTDIPDASDSARYKALGNSVATVSYTHLDVYKRQELQRLKAKAAKIPPKIRVFSFLMLMCFMLTYIVIIVYQIINSLGALF